MMEYLKITDVHELETIPRRVLIEAYNAVAPSVSKKGLSIGCMPTRNKEFFGNPLRVGWRKESLVPLVIGSTLGEFSCFDDKGINKGAMTEEEGKKKIISLLGEQAGNEIISAFKKAYPTRNPIDIIFADWMFRRPVPEHARIRAELGGKVYTYVFAVDFPLHGGKTPWHSSDIPFVMHNTECTPVEDSLKNTYIADRISQHISAFMRTGDPNVSEGEGWKPVTPEHQTTLVISDDFRLEEDFDTEFIRLAEKHAERLGNGFIHHDFPED